MAKTVTHRKDTRKTHESKKEKEPTTAETTTDKPPVTRPDVATDGAAAGTIPPVVKKAAKPLTLKDHVKKALFRSIRDEIEAVSDRLIAGTYKASDFLPDITSKFLKIPENAKITKEEDVSLIPAPPARKRGRKVVLEKEKVQKVYDLRKLGTTKPGIAKELGFKSRKTVDKAIALFAKELGAEFASDPAPASLREEESQIATRFQKNMENKALKVMAAKLGISQDQVLKLIQAQYARTESAKTQ
jgi:hypothetical protein